MLLASSVFVLFAGAAAAAGTNRTIDDETGDSATGQLPQYTTATTTAYTTNWNDGPRCTVCNIHPNATECLGQTWHDVTASPGQTASVALPFTGTAIYVFGIVPNFVANTDTVVNLTFTLDGKFAGMYFHPPDSSNHTAYNVSLFSQAGLANGAHQLIAAAAPGPTVPSLFMFDYAIYTYEESVSSVSSSISATASSSSSSPGTASSSYSVDTTSSSSPSSVSASLSSTSSSPSTSTTAANQGNSGSVTGGVVGGSLVMLAALLALMF